MPETAVWSSFPAPHAIDIPRFREGKQPEFRLVYQLLIDSLLYLTRGMVEKIPEGESIIADTFYDLFQVKADRTDYEDIRAFCFQRLTDRIEKWGREQGTVENWRDRLNERRLTAAKLQQLAEQLHRLPLPTAQVIQYAGLQQLDIQTIARILLMDESLIHLHKQLGIELLKGGLFEERWLRSILL